MIIFIYIVVSFPLIISAKEISSNPKFMSGHTTYMIKGDDNQGWKSVLNFPLNSNFIEITYQGNVDNFKIDTYEFSIARNHREYAGIFTDSDWIYLYSEDKSIYSESETRFKGWFVDVQFKTKPFVINNKEYINYYMITGYIYQDLHYDIYQTYQYNLYKDEADSFEGKTLDYSIIYLIPYTGFEVNSNNTGGFNWSLQLSYSPYITVKDRDDHLMRDKICYINANGKASMVKTKISYSIQENFSLFTEWSYKKFKATGSQTQYNRKGEILFTNIDSEVVSDQQTVAVGVTYKF